MPYLRKDINSIFYKGRLYGKAGEEVIVISDRDSMLIVQGKNGVRFATTAESVIGYAPMRADIPVHIKPTLPERKITKNANDDKGQIDLFAS